MKEIEEFFTVGDQEFGAATREYPYRLIGPTDSDSQILFATKWGCLLEGLHEYGVPDDFGLIVRYGLPCREDLSTLKSITGTRRILFLGDLDPTDLLIFAWLRSNLDECEFEHFGINDAYLDRLKVNLPNNYAIPLSQTEIAGVKLLETLCPDLEELIGLNCLKRLRSGEKIEQEAIVTYIGAQMPIFKLLEESSDR